LDFQHNFKDFHHTLPVFPVGLKILFLSLNINIPAKNDPNFAYFISFESPELGLSYRPFGNSGLGLLGVFGHFENRY
jgi:hypothetical protein